ncbi:mitochondrial carrier domain-containing protein [Glomus cerebriforme]|uniref:Mitochondrial carrier domain-containing protein n=1 Tax=Glomus cerebriforme TaxID=658196 RepID=A0A397S2Y3_9GLOM|nr:mitochondrial carrier domain-containing protein [Glomus cerebriforme]
MSGTDRTNQGGFTRAAKDCLSGTAGGIVQVFVGQPFDTIKVRLQTQQVPKPGEQPQYAGMLDCVRQTRKEGLTAFYKGTTTPLVGVGVCVSIQFLVFEFMKRLFNGRNGYSGMLSSSQLYLSGAAAGVAGAFVFCPVEHIRTRLQVQTTPLTIISSNASNASNGKTQNKKYNGPIDCFKKIYSLHGIQGIYKGMFITTIREFHGGACYFLIYEYNMQRAMLKEKKSRRELPSWKPCLYGAAAGYGMWCSIYPIDVIKSKIQTDCFLKEKRKYSSAFDCAKQTFAKEGIKGFFRGFGPCMLRAGPVNASSFVAFEMAMQLFEKI